MYHEHHLKNSNTIKDIVIGMFDGLTVPFALAAAGITEIVARSIAMGLSDFLAGKTSGWVAILR